MRLILIPKDLFKEKEKKELQKIISFAKNLLEKNKISLPNKIYFFNSFSNFVKKVLPEVKNYGFNEDISKEIILCSLNNGTYGTIDYKDNSIIEMNFNPFNKGKYSSKDFLELIIHESLHLHLSKKLNKDINEIKFKFEKEEYIGNPRIIQVDEGYAEFMTRKILNKFNIKKIKRVSIPIAYRKKPFYKKRVFGLNINLFDRNFEKALILNRNLGLKYFSENFKFTDKNEEISNFAMNELRKIL